MVEKLCQRFRVATEPRQWNDIALCLSLLPYQSEKCVRMLIDNMPFYWDKLYEPKVFGHFCDIIVKAKKFQKSESKLLLEDFERKVMELNEKNADLHLVQSIPLKKEKKAVASRVKKATKALKDMRIVDDEDDDVLLNGSDEDVMAGKKKGALSQGQARKKWTVESGDEAIQSGEEGDAAAAKSIPPISRSRPMRKAALAGKIRRAMSDNDEEGEGEGEGEGEDEDDEGQRGERKAVEADDGDQKRRVPRGAGGSRVKY